VAIATPRPSSSAVTSLVAAPGTSGAMNEEAADLSAAVEKEVVDAAAVKKVMEDAVAAERVATDKSVVDAAAMEKAMSDTAAMEGTTAEVASWDVVESSPPPVVGAKRTTASDGSTPPAKCRFRGSWKPWYAVRPCIYPSFLLCLFCFT
jgi:hypothetical protein